MFFSWGANKTIKIDLIVALSGESVSVLELMVI